MIAQNENPVAWAMFIDELSDAEGHLRSLVAQLSNAGNIDEEDFRIQLGHVFAHLNRAWNGRNDAELVELTDDLRNERSQFPLDLMPVG